MPATILRFARADEGPFLTALCLRSKAHWGYDAAFLRRCVPALTVTPALLAGGGVLVAEAGGRPFGLTAAVPDGDAVWDLALCFVEPAAMGQGIGRRLFEAQRHWLRGRGARRLTILADPGAAPFYRRMGALDRGLAPSDAIPGRLLPFLELDLARPAAAQFAVRYPA